MIHQVKSCIRTIYSCISDFHTQHYFDELCYRINNSHYKDTMFYKLINRMVKTEKIKIADLVSS